MTPAARNAVRGGLLARLESLSLLGLLLVVAGLLGWLSNRYEIEADWTAASRHTLSEASRALVETLDGPLTITAYASPNPAIRQPIEDLVGRYRRVKGDISLAFVDPDRVPSLVRDLGITFEGEMVLDFAGRTERVTRATEAEFTHALQQLARGAERFLVFVQGHGERAAHGQANHDLQTFTGQIEGRGVRVQELDINITAQVPENSSALVIAGPTVSWTPAALTAVQRWVNGGGNLLWIIDEGRLAGLEPLAERLGIRVKPGMLVDPAARLLEIKDASILPVTEYPARAVVGRFDLVTVFPTASGLEHTPLEGWAAESILRSGEQVWSETGPLDAGMVKFDEGDDLMGPFDLGLALTRPRASAPGRLAPEPGELPPPSAEQAPPPVTGEPPSAKAPAAQIDATLAADQAVDAAADTTATPDTVAADVPADADADSTANAGQQRVVVLGDGDFLSNQYLGNAGNLDLGTRLVDWLTGDEQLIEVPARLARDRQLELSDPVQATIGLLALLGIPAALLLTGFTLWWRRRARA
ncbi:MAG TPA: hypothetical protein DCY89_00435 [Gammaproteobacteria bacterium]|nr:hypothetical protein [Gammaproteobacteria bacterium]